MSLSDSEYVTIDKDIRNTGFFSEYLPPCFQLNPKAFLQPPPFECDLIPPYNFNMSTALGVVGVASYVGRSSHTDD